MNARRTKTPIEFDTDYPPFPGFGKPAFTFLKEIAKNNTREWLTQERKEFYKHHLAEPMKMLLAELRLRFQLEGMPYMPQEKRNVFRLYRDIRFSNDKRPFKTNIGAVIPFLDEPNEGLGGYIHIEPGGCMVAGGSYSPDAGRLKLIRSAIDRDPKPLRTIIANLAEVFGPIRGEQLKRSPVGYDETHPAIDLLRYKQMWAYKSFPDKLAGSRELIDWIINAARELQPLNEYLYTVFRGNA